jgi:uncharacterized membrane-anchored protein
MGKNELRVVRIPRWATVILLLLVSGAMALTIHLLSGHAYQREPSFAEIVAMMLRYKHDTATTPALLATIAPAIAGALFFIPWGALAFLSFDAPGRPRRVTYFVTMTLGVAFALGLVASQEVMPTRVTGSLDALWNAVGCAAGAALGYSRKRFRVRFQ